MKLLKSYLIPNGNGDSIWTIITVNVITVIIIFAFDRCNHHWIVTKLFSKEQNMRQADNKPAVTCHSQNWQRSLTFSSPLYKMEFLSSCKYFIQVVYLLLGCIFLFSGIYFLGPKKCSWQDSSGFFFFLRFPEEFFIGTNLITFLFFSAICV